MEQEEIKGQMDIFDFKECIPDQMLDHETVYQGCCTLLTERFMSSE